MPDLRAYLNRANAIWFFLALWWLCSQMSWILMTLCFSFCRQVTGSNFIFILLFILLPLLSTLPYKICAPVFFLFQIHTQTKLLWIANAHYWKYILSGLIVCQIDLLEFNFIYIILFFPVSWFHNEAISSKLVIH